MTVCYLPSPPPRAAVHCGRRSPAPTQRSSQDTGTGTAAEGEQGQQ